MEKIWKEKKAFAKKIFNLTFKRLKEHENETMYMCDIGMALTMPENQRGYFCSKEKSLRDIKKYFYEFIDFGNWYYDNFGEKLSIDNNIENIYCKFIICAVDSVCSSVFAMNEYWNDEVLIDKDFISDFKKILDNNISYNIF